MNRRHFIAASVAASALPPPGELGAQAPAAPHEFYLVRAFHLQSGPQTALTEHFFADALIPTLSRLDLGPIGAFRLDFGAETPIFYLLIPGPNVQLLAELDQRLAADPTFLKAAAPFWNAPASSPPFQRVESSLLSAFAGWPRLIPPATSASKSKRIFQLRIYESPTPQDHVRKVEMFHAGEFRIFSKAGCHPIFFADTLIAARTPSLMYMLSFADMDELNAGWAAFSADPAWKKLRSDPRYTFEEIVSNISSLILVPLSCSQL